jgi:hypothetical protein
MFNRKGLSWEDGVGVHIVLSSLSWDTSSRVTFLLGWIRKVAASDLTREPR